MDDRIERERKFYDHANGEGTRAGIAKYYTAAKAGRAHYRSLVEAHGEGGDVLEIGCGSRGAAVHYLTDRASSIVGVDISGVAVDEARARHGESAGAAPLRFERMDVERLGFRDGSFDLVCGSGILHHLDLAAGCAEIARVLRPGGHAVFLEPLGHNPLINLFRRRTPELRTIDEHPLRMDDLTAAEAALGPARHRFFALTALALVPFRRRSWFGRAARCVERLDSWLFRRLPFLRRHAWIVVSEYRMEA